MKDDDNELYGRIITGAVAHKLTPFLLDIHEFVNGYANRLNRSHFKDLRLEDQRKFRTAALMIMAEALGAEDA